jgi:mRNA-degrading endonuclease RelE of RelBE toxin-antitoxin system
VYQQVLKYLENIICVKKREIMSEQLKSYCDNISNSIINAYKMGVQNGNIEKYRDTTNIENLAKKLCQVEALFSNELNAINNSTFRDLKTFDQETKKVLQDCSQTVSNEASISKRYHDITEGCATIYLAATEMKEGTTQFQGDRTVIDDDVQMGTTEQFTDPITKKQIQNVIHFYFITLLKSNFFYFIAIS